MKLRVAKKVCNRILAGYEYRTSTKRRSDRRLEMADMPTWGETWFYLMLDRFHERDPLGLARFQFDCGMKLHAAVAERRRARGDG